MECIKCNNPMEVLIDNVYICKKCNIRASIHPYQKGFLSPIDVIRWSKLKIENDFAELE